ncbi:MAG: peptidoglycan DD-metalloendopeptidase family protein [Pseudomonadota bacterium]
MHAQSDEEQTRAQLRQLEEDIKRITWEISSETTRRSRLQRKLKDAETALGELRRDINANEQAIASTEDEQTALALRSDSLQAQRQAQQERLALELKTAWQTSRKGQLKVLLNQENPHTVARSMAYYRYFLDARNETLHAYRATLQEIAEVEQSIAANREQLQARSDQLEQQLEALVATQQEREQALAALKSSIDSKSAQLKQKEADRKEREELLRAIEEAVVNLQLPSDYQAFTKAKGVMPWPVAGKPSNRFGRSRNQGKMRWQGVMIPAKEGASVQAIHHGRVVYSDWLRGSGLLIIIDHGEGYMSLYAHNQSLLRDVGEWVSAGTPIATVGSSGGQERAALYFEVRHKGEPTDPAKWCQG